MPTEQKIPSLELFFKYRMNLFLYKLDVIFLATLVSLSIWDGRQTLPIKQVLNSNAQNVWRSRSEPTLATTQMRVVD